MTKSLRLPVFKKVGFVLLVQEILKTKFNPPKRPLINHVNQARYNLKHFLTLCPGPEHKSR